MLPQLDLTRLDSLKPAIAFLIEHKGLVGFFLGLFLVTLILRPDTFQDLRRQIMRIRRHAKNGGNLQRIRIKVKRMEFQIDEARRKDKISALDKEYLDNLLSQALYLNMSASA